MTKIFSFISFALLLNFSQIIYSQCIQNPEFNNSSPKRDLRGVFLASVYNINWPSNNTATPAVQQAELISILNNVKTNGYNSVFLQIRPESDALYASSLEPWSYRLTGTQGQTPSPWWDPLAFAVIEAHARGLDIHAWLNPYRVRANVTEYTSATNHILNTQPTWILTASNNTNLKFLNPGLPAVQDYITGIVQDISGRYDIDGIHFDDYFYPSGGMTTSQDNQTYQDNNPTNIATIEDWRRYSVNKMIGQVYDAIQVININQNKNIVFGVSNSGIWKSGIPAGTSGNPSYSALFCDPIAWLTADKVDYLAPQLYWKITGAQDYIALSNWWNDQVEIAEKQLYPSLAFYRMSDTSNWPATEIQNQIIQNRITDMPATFGQIAYNYNSIKNNDKDINTLLNTAQFQFKSFAPPIVGKDNVCPNIPVNQKIEGLTLKWDTPSAASDGDLPVKYVIYAFDNASEAITNQEDGSKILDIVAGNELVLTSSLINSKLFVITSLDKNNNENGNFYQTLNTTSLVSSSENINIYPNPFEESFSIQSNIDFVGQLIVYLYDYSGKLVWKQESKASNSILEVTPHILYKGLYVGKLIFENGKTENFKLIKV